MVSKDRKIRVGLVLGILMTLSINSVFAMYPMEELLKNIKIISPKGVHITNNQPLERPLDVPSDYEKENGRPATWGDFVYQVGVKFDRNVEFILKYNRSRKELIITKEEIADSFRLLLEDVNKVKINATGRYRVKAMVNGISLQRNYLSVPELTSLLEADVKLTSTGDLTEKIIVKIADVQGDIVKVNRVLSNTISEEKFISALKVPWKHEHKIYEIDVVGNKIMSVDALTDINYGIVSQKKGALYVGDMELESLKSPQVGNFIEYTVNNDKAYMINNYGMYTSTYLVKSVDNSGISTYEGNILSKSLKVIDEDGIEIGQNSLKQGSVLAKFGNYLIMGGIQSEHQVKYYKDKIYIDNVGYSISGLKMSNGVKIQDLKEFKYLDKISKAKITWDVLGNPKIAEVERVEFVTYIQKVTDKVLTGVYTGGTLPADLEWNKTTTPIQPYTTYRMIIIDNKVVEAEKVNASSGYLNRIYGDYVYVGNKPVIISPSTATLFRTVTTSGTNITEYAIKTYSEVLAEVDKNRSSYLWVGVYSIDGITADLMVVHQISTTDNQPSNDTHKDVLEQTPLNIYKVNAFGWDIAGESSITLSDSNNTSIFKVPNSYMLAGLSYGDYVTVHMSVKGVIDWISKFEYTHQNITTTGLAKYMGLPSNISKVESITLGSEKAVALRTENILYEITGEVITQVPSQVALEVGKTYLIIKQGELIKVTVGGGI